MALVTLVGAGVVVANLRRSATGIRWLAVRANERAAAAAGVNVARTKLGAFAFSSALAGMGGVLLAYRYQALSVESFTVFASLSLIALTYLGGIASITGALFAGLLIPGGILTSLLDQGGSGSQYQLAISGLALILVAVLYPEGIGGAIRKITATRKAARPVEQLAHSH
jgi:branched-chain amino acid transport system permease protein